MKYGVSREDNNLKTILVADEDSKAKNLVRLVSEQTGYKIVATSSGVQAVLKAKDIKPDIVLAAVSLSDKNGYEVSREIKNDPSLKNTFVLLLSASPITFDRRKAAEVYADDFILKPLRSEELITKLGPLAVQNKNEPKLLMKPKAQSIRSIAEGKVIFVNVIAAVFVIFMFIAPVSYHLSYFSLFDFGPSKIQLKQIHVFDKGKGIRNNKEEAFTEGNTLSFSELKAHSAGLVNSIEEKARDKEVFQAHTRAPAYVTLIGVIADVEKEGAEKSGLDKKPLLSSNQRLPDMGDIPRGAIKNANLEKRKILALALETNKGKEGQTTKKLKPTQPLKVTLQKDVEEEAEYKDRVLEDVEELILERKGLALKTEEGKKKETSIKDVYELAEEVRKKIGE
ncbi:MAG: response regulator [Thermodesulfobacteriota bacterium]